MSNAVVINATNASGWTVGSPITIETGGDVVLKAYGTGSGSWSVTLAFAPVVGGVTGSPTTLTIGPNAPSAKTAVTKSDATQWVGWVSQAEGTWEASGLVEGYTDDEALANDLGYFASSTNLPTKALKLGAKATLPSGPVTWRGAVDGWGDATTISAPPASGSYVGQIIWVANPAVPRGRSRLEWTGTVWAPPAGELIAAIWRGAAPVALVTPGNTSLTVVYQSPIIPDYMLPANIKANICGFMSAKNAAGVANCLLGFAVSGTVPTVGYQYDYAYPLSRSVTPSASGIGIGMTPTPKTRQCGIISLPNARNYFLQPYNYVPLEISSTDFPFVTGKNRVYAMAQPSGAADQIQLDGYSLISEGNL